MAFRDLGELLHAGLSLPHNGKTDVIPRVDAENRVAVPAAGQVAAQAAQAAETGDELDAVVLDDAGAIGSVPGRARPGLRRHDRGSGAVADAEGGRRDRVAGCRRVPRGRRGLLERGRDTGPGSAGRESGEPPGGPIDPATGLREWYDPHRQGSGDGEGRSWAEIFERWSLVEADLHELYGIDVESGILRTRSWRWLRTRIAGLLTAAAALVGLQPFGSEQYSAPTAPTSSSVLTPDTATSNVSSPATAKRPSSPRCVPRRSPRSPTSRCRGRRCGGSAVPGECR